MTPEATITGWLFDLYPSRRGITLWIIDRDGRKHCCTDSFRPAFYLHVPESDDRRVAELVGGFPFAVTLDRTVRREIYTDTDWNVLRVTLHDTLHLRDVVRRLERHFPHYVFFDSDIMVQQSYLYQTGLFPLARGEYAIAADGCLTGWHLDDSVEAIDYDLPPLTTMTLKNRPDFVSPKHRRTYQLEVTYDDRTYALENEEPAEIIGGLNRHIRRCDPDIVMTEYGDAILLPLLTRLATEEGIPLELNRDPDAGYFTTNESSYFAYGKIVHKDGAFELAGRWHLDTENSFMMAESSLDGVAEIARLTQLPVQHQSRATIGSALSSMQLSWAVRHGYLVPAKKREPEEFKPASTLLLADRGGLIFQPVMGFHEQIAEMDFVSMYPTIMVEHNVSPETVNCRCCSNHAVPELGYTICERREGIVPATLRTVVAKRAKYKKLKKSLKKGGDEQWHLYDRRQNALKWMLVTCFGYLGYKNARFGRIEAHESVNAFSRDAILRAKEIAEARGYRFIHAIVDCMWLSREGSTEEEYNVLAEEVTREVGIDISLEGIYNWILFPASKMDPHIPTANKYVGWYMNNEIKIRGIEIRRRDTPVFIKRLQGEMLKLFGQAATVTGVEALVPAALTLAGDMLSTLRSGKADPLELVVHRHLTREAEEYTTNTANAAATKALDEAGVHLAPGEMVDYIIVDMSGKRKPAKALPVALYSADEGYDIETYTGMTLKAVETLLLPFGYDVPRLREALGCPLAKKKVSGRKLPSQMTLFDTQHVKP
jgi:DNA polymerase elongation subunit (family B)